MMQQHQHAALQHGSAMVPPGWPFLSPHQQQAHAVVDPAEAAATARWAEAQGENEAAPETMEGSNQPEDQQPQHGGGKSSADGHSKVKRPPGVQQCPRCNSKNTKFCYYNNYNVKQPRYYCRDCQRYWTAGGTLRQLAPGAGRRKTKPTATGKPEQGELHQHKDSHHKQHGTRQQTQSGEATPQLARAESVAVQASPQDNMGALDASAAAAAAAAADVLLSSGASDLLSPGGPGLQQLDPLQLPEGLIPNTLPHTSQALAGMQAQQQQQPGVGMLAAGGLGTSQHPASQHPLPRMQSTGYELPVQQQQQAQFPPPLPQQQQQLSIAGGPFGQFQQLLDPAAAAAAGIPPSVAAATLAAAAAAGLGGPFGSAALMQAQQQWQNAATAAAAAALDPYRNLGALAAMATAATGQPGPVGHYFMAAAAAAAAAAAGMMPGGIDTTAASMAAALGLSGMYPQQAQVQQQQLMAAAAAAAGGMQGFMGPGLEGMGAMFGPPPPSQQQQQQQQQGTQSQQTQPGLQFLQQQMQHFQQAQQMQHFQQAQQMQQMAAYQQQFQQAMIAGGPGLPASQAQQQQQPVALPTPAALPTAAAAGTTKTDVLQQAAAAAEGAPACGTGAGTQPAAAAAGQPASQPPPVKQEADKALMPPPPPLYMQQQQQGQVRPAGDVAVPDGSAGDGRRVRQRTASTDGQEGQAEAADAPADGTAAAAVAAAAPATAAAVAGVGPAGAAGVAGQQQEERSAVGAPQAIADALAQQQPSEPVNHVSAAAPAPPAAAGEDTGPAPGARPAPTVEPAVAAPADAAVAAVGGQQQDMAVHQTATACDPAPAASSALPAIKQSISGMELQQQASLAPLPLPAPSLPLQQQQMQQQAAAQMWHNQMQQQYQQQQQLLQFQQQLQFQGQLQQQQNQNQLQGLLQHMQGQLQQQKQVPPELMIMAQHMQQQLAGMGMLQNALAAGSSMAGIGPSCAAGGPLPPGLHDACTAAALGLLPHDWVQQQMMTGGLGMGLPPGGVGGHGGLMPPGAVAMFAAGPGPDVPPAQVVKAQMQQQQQLQQAAAQLAAASAAVTGGPAAAAQFAAALQAQQQQQQQQQGQGGAARGSTPQPGQNPAAPAGMGNNDSNNPALGVQLVHQNPVASSRWPQGSDAAAAAAAAGFWPGLGGAALRPVDVGAVSGRLPGLTGLGMSGMTPQTAGLSMGQAQSGGTTNPCAAVQLGQAAGSLAGQEAEVPVAAAAAPSVGGAGCAEEGNRVAVLSG